MLAAPPPPPAPAHDRNPSSGGTPSPPPPELVAIAAELARTTDPLQGNALAHKALLASMADVLADVNLTPAARRKELRVIAAAAKDLLPDARRWEAEEMIRADRDILTAKSRQKKGAKLEPMPDAVPPPLELAPDIAPPVLDVFEQIIDRDPILKAAIEDHVAMIAADPAPDFGGAEAEESGELVDAHDEGPAAE